MSSLPPHIRGRMFDLLEEAEERGESPTHDQLLARAMAEEKRLQYAVAAGECSRPPGSVFSFLDADFRAWVATQNELAKRAGAPYLHRDQLVRLWCDRHNLRPPNVAAPAPALRLVRVDGKPVR